MGELVQEVKDGQVVQNNTTTSKSAKSNNTLDKEAFLQLLVAQMKYQDPLNPSTDTEFVAQLATFSQLEQMQNLNSVTTNSQALSLVGKNVIIKTTSSTGTVNYIDGKVDYVNIANGKAYLSIDDKLYSIDDLYRVIDDTYLLEQGRPRINKKAELVYDADSPNDLSFEVFPGEGESVADEVAVIVNTTLLDSSVVTLKDNKITIDKSVFEGAANGTYSVTVVFNDKLTTVVKDMVTVTVKNAKTGSGDTKDTNDTEDVENPTDSTEPADTNDQGDATKSDGTESSNLV